MNNKGIDQTGYVHAGLCFCCLYAAKKADFLMTRDLVTEYLGLLRFFQVL